jgi:hypothetical protein
MNGWDACDACDFGAEGAVCNGAGAVIVMLRLPDAVEVLAILVVAAP